MRDVADLEIDPQQAAVYEHGWQSWSPSSWYRVHDRPPRSVVPDDVFWGEGMPAVDPGDGAPVHVFATPDARTTVCQIRARSHDDHVIISIGGEADHIVDPGPDAAPTVERRADWARVVERDGGLRGSSITHVPATPFDTMHEGWPA